MYIVPYVVSYDVSSVSVLCQQLFRGFQMLPFVLLKEFSKLLKLR